MFYHTGTVKLKWEMTKEKVKNMVKFINIILQKIYITNKISIFCKKRNPSKQSMCKYKGNELLTGIYGCMKIIFIPSIHVHEKMVYIAAYNKADNNDE